MCVIVAVENDEFKPSPEQLEQMHRKNSDGAGIAWLSPEGKVRFVKGLKDDKEVLQTIESRQIKAPYIIHFRITSSGATCKELTHPFPVTYKAETALKGETSEVLFHNGTWHNYDAVLMQLMFAKGRGDLPDGEWNDSRVMALILARHGENMLRFLLERNTSKVMTLDKNGVNILAGEFIQHQGYIVSNDYWIPAAPVQYSTTGKQFVNIDHLTDAPEEQKNTVLGAIKKSPKWATCSGGKCLIELYKGSKLAEPQSGDNCKSCDSNGTKCTRTTTTTIPVVVDTTLPVAVAPASQTSDIFKSSEQKKCVTTHCYTMVPNGKWFCESCEQGYEQLAGTI